MDAFEAARSLDHVPQTDILKRLADPEDIAIRTILADLVYHRALNLNSLCLPTEILEMELKREKK